MDVCPVPRKLKEMIDLENGLVPTALPMITRVLKDFASMLTELHTFNQASQTMVGGHPFRCRLVRPSLLGALQDVA